MIDLGDEYQRKDPRKLEAARVNEQNYLLRPEAHRVPGVLTFGYTNFQSGFVNAWTRRHKHPSHMEIAVLLKGSQTYEVENQRYVLTGNHFFLVPANVQHCAIENPHMSTFLYFLLDISAESPLFSLNEEHSRHLVEAMRGIPLTICDSTPTINHLIVKAFENLLSSDPFCWYTAQAQFATLLHAIIRQYEAGAATPYDAAFVDRITEYIDAHITQRITLEEMSSTLGYSATYLKKRFIQIFGMTPHYYITKQKMNRATQLLREGHSVTYTAMELAFSSSNHFSTVFKRHMLVSPSAYCRLQAHQGEPPSQ